ncbi:hypothetical protein Agub_g11226 [Astrephomene gubernaculifera]|uniref:Uncharacterized protein n=1 Tax=Astrephomene gubernaculifera TaxID=47775 RepID=A0AAD3DYN4_9CHLO|nr:hypothetical protein Agub_g11226 [Astrephomene gubernaculifera]
MALLSKRTLRGLVSEVLCTRGEEECDVATPGLQRPPEQQRLVFSPYAPIAVTCCEQNPLSAALQAVQAVIFQDSRALGRLVKPRVIVDSPEELSPVALVSLVYDYWQPTSSDRKLGPQQHLRIPLDARYRSTSVFSVSAILVGRPGGTLALPGQHEWSGSKTAAAVNQHQQRIKYIQESQRRYAQGEGKDSPNRHPLARSEAEYTIETGPEWEASSLALTFNTASELPWLQRVILKLLVIPQEPVDDKGGPADHNRAEVTVSSFDSGNPGCVAMASASTTQPVPQGHSGHQQTTSGRVKSAADDQHSSSQLRQGKASSSGAAGGYTANMGAGSQEAASAAAAMGSPAAPECDAPSSAGVKQMDSGGAHMGDAASRGTGSFGGCDPQSSEGISGSIAEHGGEICPAVGLPATRGSEPQSGRRRSEVAEGSTPVALEQQPQVMVRGALCDVPAGSLSDRDTGSQSRRGEGDSKCEAQVVVAPEERHVGGSPISEAKPTVKLIPGPASPGEPAQSDFLLSPGSAGSGAVEVAVAIRERTSCGGDEVTSMCKSGCCGTEAGVPAAVDASDRGSSASRGGKPSSSVPAAIACGSTRAAAVAVPAAESAGAEQQSSPSSVGAALAAASNCGAALELPTKHAQQLPSASHRAEAATGACNGSGVAFLQPLPSSTAPPPPPPPPPPPSQRQYPNGAPWPQPHVKGSGQVQDQHHQMHQAAASAPSHMSQMPHLPPHHHMGHAHAIPNGQPHTYPNGLEAAALLQQLLMAQQNGPLQLQLHQQHQQLQGLLSSQHMYGWQQHHHHPHQQLAAAPPQPHLQVQQQQQQQQLMHHAAVQQHVLQQHMLQQAVAQQQQQHHQQQQQLLLQGLAHVHMGHSESHGAAVASPTLPVESSSGSSFTAQAAPAAVATTAASLQPAQAAAADSPSAAAVEPQPHPSAASASSVASAQPTMPAPINAPTPMVAQSPVASAGDSAGPSSWETGSASSVRSEPTSAVAPALLDRPMGQQHRVQSQGNMLAAAHGGGGGGGSGGHGAPREGGGRSTSSYRGRTSYNGVGGGAGSNNAGGGGSSGVGHASGTMSGSGQYGNRSYGNTGGGQRHGAGSHGYASRGGRYDAGHAGSAESSRPSSRGPPAHGGGSYSRHAHPADPVPPPDALPLPDPKGSCDLDRFISQIEPVIAIDPAKPPQQALQELRLRDLWNFYFEPSLYGREVFTLGGHRGASNSYFVPYLSAIQIFTRALPTDVGGTNRLYVSEDNQGWPKHMHLKFEYFEHELPFNRLPLYDQIEHLSGTMAAAAAAAAAGGGGGGGTTSGGGASSAGYAAGAGSRSAAAATPVAGAAAASRGQSAGGAATAAAANSAAAATSERPADAASKTEPVSPATAVDAAANDPVASCTGSARISEQGDGESAAFASDGEPSSGNQPADEASSEAEAAATSETAASDAAATPLAAPTAADTESAASGAPASTSSAAEAEITTTSQELSAAKDGAAPAVPAATAASAGVAANSSSGGGSSTSQPDGGPPSVGGSSDSTTTSSGGSATGNSTTATGSRLLYDMRLLDVHPASWFAVAWYPVYRIPDAPLYARFLTFHSFAPLVESMRNVHERLAMGQVAPCCLLSLPVVGLNWYNMQGERWLEPLDESAVAAAHLQAHGGPPQPPASAPGSISGSSPRVPPVSRGGGGGGGRVGGTDVWYQHLLHNLQSTADRLARGVGLRVLGQHGAEEVRLRVPDYEFFRARS